LTISCPGVITRIITLPILNPKDLEKLLTEQVDQYFTLNIEDYLIDYRFIEKFEEDGQQRQRILLAAIPRSEWEKLLKSWNELDFHPKVVDLAGDSLSRLYSQVGWANGSFKKTTFPDLAIVDLGPDRVEIVLLEHGIFFLYADLEVNLKGLEEYAESLKNVQPSHMLSEKLIPEGTSEKNLELNPQELTEIWAQNEMEGILKPVLQGLSDFLNFFASRHFGKSVDYLFITGYYSNVPLVQNIFEQVLEHETHIGFPEGWHPRFNKRLKPLQESWMKYGSLYGLALRED
jgi:type IV pilus assembly protein PilM